MAKRSPLKVLLFLILLLVVAYFCKMGWEGFYAHTPPEVFHISGYNNTLADAPGVCQSLGARVATYAELDEAQKNGANWCSTGWVSDRGNRNAFYPITYDTMGGCGNGRSGIIDWIGNDDWFGQGTGKGFKAGVNCFGNKPEEKDIKKIILPGNAANSSGVMPFNKYQWSRYPGSIRAECPACPTCPDMSQYILRSSCNSCSSPNACVNMAPYMLKAKCLMTDDDPDPPYMLISDCNCPTCKQHRQS